MGERGLTLKMTHKPRYRSGQQLQATIETLITEDNVRQAVAVAVEALSATQMKRGPREAGRITYDEVPDWSARIAAVHFLAEGKYGKPKQRVEMNHSGDDATREQTRREGIKALLSRPDELRRMLDALALASGGYIDIEGEKPKALTEENSEK